MPNSEMMKSTQRYGWKLVCGWLPPVDVTELALMGFLGASAPYGVMPTVGTTATALVRGDVLAALLFVASMGWECAGIWLTVRVMSSAPPVSARMKLFPW